MKDELGGKVMRELTGLKTETCSCLRDNKKRNSIKKVKFQDYKICLEAVQIENEINHLEKNKIHAASLKEGYEEFIKINRLIFKTQQRFRSKKKMFFK